MAGSGLGCRQVARRDEVHAGRDDGAQVVGQDDRAVELRQLAQGLLRALDADLEAAGGDLLHLLVVAEHDERAGAPVQDAVDARAQGCAGREQLQVAADRRFGHLTSWWIAAQSRWRGSGWVRSRRTVRG